ncbi:MAG: dienelactone hydrolase family protein [Phycisphaerae bacterium]
MNRDGVNRRVVARWMICIIVALVAQLPACVGPASCSHTADVSDRNAEQTARSVFVDASDPFSRGVLAVRSLDVASCELGAPTAMRIHVPEEADDFPVIVFQHGFMTRNSGYDEILQHVASHGFVVVAPQMYEPGIGPLLGNPTAAAEAELAGDVLGWISQRLQEVIGFDARADRIGIAGHSRGGKVAWLMAAANRERFLAIAGIDPVDGAGGPLGNQARVVQGQFSFSIPALIIGTELGGSCAPAGDNHVQFYAASQPPAWHFVAVNQGHGDMLDETEAKAAAMFCASGPDRAGMRRLTGGLLTAFFRAALQDDASSYSYLSGQAATPIPVLAEGK